VDSPLPGFFMVSVYLFWWELCTERGRTRRSSPNRSLCIEALEGSPPDVEGDFGAGRPSQETVLAGMGGELEVLKGAVFEPGRDAVRKVVLVVGPVGCHEIPDLDGIVRRRNPSDALPAFETLGDVFHGLSIPFPGGTLHRPEAFFSEGPRHTPISSRASWRRISVTSSRRSFRAASSQREAVRLACISWSIFPAVRRSVTWAMSWAMCLASMVLPYPFGVELCTEG